MLDSTKTNKPATILILWIFLLSIALLSTQGVKLHVHDVDHAHEQQFSHETAIEDDEHSHLAEAHLSIDLSHADHHDDIASEIDAGHTTLLKNIASKVLTLALLVTLLVLLLSTFHQYKFFRHRKNEVIFSWQYHLSPPLRAPPL